MLRPLHDSESSEVNSAIIDSHLFKLVSIAMAWKESQTTQSGRDSCQGPGEKAWPPLLMFKALLLQSWYNLSGPKLEKQLARDLLFRRFVELDLSESVPDHSTFWRFRQTLQKSGLMEAILAEIN